MRLSGYGMRRQNKRRVAT
ncbi:hypothetical protein Golax_017917 [Gossypium laxum]|uniref:Uncharacterized protein n=1 Tax=Gossypium laxum TaxID=34288 RepID=A0A7J8Z1P1_9ROSI|nr:hypothetical protein [Gossypium laxum]